MTHPVGELLPAWLAGVDAAYAIPLALFLFGLAGGFSHCAGMCAPFVLAQVGARLAQLPVAAGGGIARLAAGLLPAYHLGRFASYAGLGALAGAFGGALAELAPARWVVPFGLGLGALAFAAAALGGFGAGAGPLGRVVGRLAGPLLRRADRASTSFVLGLVLGLLPCHMIYAALAVAATRGSALQGAAAMTVFMAGTTLGLTALGAAGMAAGARARMLARRALPFAGLANALLLAALAVRAAAGG